MGGVNSRNVICKSRVRKAHCLQIAQFWVTDGAPDERNVGHLLYRDDAPNMKFRFVDDPHCKQTVLKHVYENDAELQELEHKLCKGERSLARYIKNSKRYQAKFTKQQIEDDIAVLQDFCYAEQRFDSKKKPFGRASLKLKAMIQTLADEAEDYSQFADRRAWAAELLDYFTQYKHLVLMGLNADFLHEASCWNHKNDKKDPDIARAGESTEEFLYTLDTMFVKGMVRNIRSKKMCVCARKLTSTR